MIRWTKKLPFGIMLVHRTIYTSYEDALLDRERINKEVVGFELRSDEEIAETKSYRILTPFKDKPSVDEKR